MVKVIQKSAEIHQKKTQQQKRSIFSTFGPPVLETYRARIPKMNPNLDIVPRIIDFKLQ